MTAIPDLFKSLHAEIMDCELKGQTALADALRRSLNRSIRLSGLGEPTEPDTVQANHDRLVALAYELKARAS